MTTATGLAQIRAGRVAPLAQSGASRSPQLPDLPLLKELTPADIQKRAEAEAGIWGGLIKDLKIQIE